MYNPETLSRVTLASLGIVFQTALSVLSRLRLSRRVQNLSRITRMRRICSFHGFFCLDYFFLSDLYAPVGRWDFHGLSLARYCLPDSSFCARSPSALSPRSKSITDNPDATDLFFFTDFFVWIIFFLSDLYAPVGRWDFHGFTLVCGLSADFSCYMQSSAVQAQIQSEGNPRPSKSKNKKKSVKKIKSVASAFYVKIQIF